MPDNDDYNDVLGSTVEEAKNQIEELEDPDYEKLLELESEGKDRKTLTEWLQDRIDEQDYEVDSGDAVEEGFLESFSPGAVLAGGAAFGLIAGLLVGLVAASFISTSVTGEATPADVEESLQGYADAVAATGQVNSAQVDSVEERNGMYVATVLVEAQQLGTNETQEQEVELYVSPDGQMMFPQSMNIKDAINQIGSLQQQQEQLPEQEQ